ncbi:MAG: hypothetical protein JNL10_02425 [Verrucomicrobiales bacterium]|nr:hypothetical protein [Verrucomicrobiales bacterium]
MCRYSLWAPFIAERPELTDRRQKRALAANPASDAPERLNSKRGAAGRVERFYRQHDH